MGTRASGLSLRRLAAGAGLAILAFFCWGIYRAGLGETPPPASSSDIVFNQGKANGERITTRSWTAQYDKLVSNADQSVLDLDNVRNGTIFKAGKPYLHVRAEHMTVNTLTRDFAVTGRLHVETVGSKPARSFDTTSAHWSDGLQILELDNRVTIETGAEAPLSVGRLTLNVKTGAVEMHGVSGPIRFK
jgi:hypothetical protein